MKIPKITPQQAIRALDSGAAVPVDVRQPDEFAAGHIPGAVLLPLSEITAQRAAAALPEQNAVLYVYCRSGVRSAAAAQKLAALGYRNLFDLGGLMGWPYELQEGESTPPSK